MSANDPWGSPNENDSTHASQDNIGNDLEQGFDDNFNDRLPDHEEYLKLLESKLEKLQKKSSISQQIRNRKNDEARRMLDASAAAVELYEDADLPENSALNRRLFPERQALTLSEIATLLENDKLAENVNDEEPVLTEEQDKPVSDN